MLGSLYLLIPLTLLFILLIALALWWAVFSGQFEDINKQGESILDDDDSPQDSDQ